MILGANLHPKIAQAIVVSHVRRSFINIFQSLLPNLTMTSTTTAYADTFSGRAYPPMPRTHARKRQNKMGCTCTALGYFCRLPQPSGSGNTHRRSYLYSSTSPRGPHGVQSPVLRVQHATVGRCAVRPQC